MQDLLDKILFYSKGIWLQRKFIVIFAWLICPFGWLYVMQMPDEYRANAKVYVDTQSLLRPLLKGITVDTFHEQQLNTMVKTLLSRPNLEKIARMSDLDIYTKNDIEFNYLIDNLANEIEIGATRKDKIFTIGYENSSKESAKQVVQSVLTIFVEKTLGETRSDADTAHRFLSQQIKEYEQRLLNDETKLTEFKRKNLDLLPGEGTSYYDAQKKQKNLLEATLLTLQEVESSLFSARMQLEDEENTPKIQAQAYAYPQGSITTQYDSRLNQLNSTLDELSLKFTEVHPDVRELNRKIEDLKQKQRNERNELLALKRDQQESMEERNESSPFLQSLKLNVSQLENEVASLKVRAKSHQEKLKSLEKKVHLVPEIEAQMVALRRGYEITKAKYEKLLERKDSAVMAQKAEQSADSIEFKVIEPPRVESDPVGPHRVALLSLVTLLGIGLGVFISLSLSRIQPVVTSAKELAKITNLPVLGSISDADIASAVRQRRLQNLVFSITMLVLLSAYVGLLMTEANMELAKQFQNIVVTHSPF